MKRRNREEKKQNKTKKSERKQKSRYTHYEEANKRKSISFSLLPLRLFVLKIIYIIYIIITTFILLHNILYIPQVIAFERIPAAR